MRPCLTASWAVAQSFEHFKLLRGYLVTYLELPLVTSVDYSNSIIWNDCLKLNPGRTLNIMPDELLVTCLLCEQLNYRLVSVLVFGASRIISHQTAVGYIEALATNSS